MINMYPNQKRLLNFFRSINSCLSENGDKTDLDFTTCPTVIFSPDQHKQLSHNPTGGKVNLDLLSVFDKWDNLLLSCGETRCQLIRKLNTSPKGGIFFISSVQCPAEMVEANAYVTCYGTIGMAINSDGVSIGIPDTFNQDDLLSNGASDFGLLTIQDGAVIHDGETIDGEFVHELLNVDATRLVIMLSYMQGHTLVHEGGYDYRVDQKEIDS